ncbi:unnamed protein product [Parnassius apollo]|uniref:(apollo) hypothetical protein n=1 Tax=Parnassius apollo TaxID=110799 RepID=A0A8S3WU81_PARAO|nr:unnamed protein product [Parnassius apollo]
MEKHKHRFEKAKLLKKLIIDLNQNAKDNILAGFRKQSYGPLMKIRKSVGTETEEYVDTEEDNFENTRKIKTAETTTITCIKTKKGKGRGKKTKKTRPRHKWNRKDKIEVADTEAIPRIEVANTETIHRIEVADIETMPVMFEDITLFGEEVEIPRDDNSQQCDDLYFSGNLELIDDTIHEQAPSKPKALCTEDR